MKITAIFLFIVCLHAQASGYGQGISVSAENAPISRIFREINRQTGYLFLFNDQLLLQAKKVTIHVKDATLDEVLQKCFENQPLEYTIKGKTVVVRPKASFAKQFGIATDSSFVLNVRGQVINEKAEPVQASIVVKGTNNGTTTNQYGEFQLPGVKEDAILVISGVGIEEKELKLNGRSQIVIAVKTAIKPLDEVQMIAYGKVTKRLNTGNVSTIKANVIEQQPVNNPLLALAGRTPGVFINQNSGFAGSGLTVRIQGQNSLINGNDPLYIIDGVPYTSQLLPNLSTVLNFSGSSSSGTGNPLFFINPSNIESIDVLKDADATAIYGSRAANGAILITTKKGTSGKTKFDIDIRSGLTKLAKEMDVLKLPQYLEMRNEAQKNDGIAPTVSNSPDLMLWDTLRSTNWQKELLGKTGKLFDAQLTVSGGSDNTTFSISGGYRLENSVLPGRFKDEKKSLQINLTNRSQNNKFHIQFSGSYLIDKNELPSVDLTTTAVQLAPNAPSMLNSDGSLNWAPETIGGPGTWGNPLAWLKRNYSGTTNNLIANVNAGYKIVKTLELSAMIGYTNMGIDERTSLPMTYYDPAYWYIGNFLRGASFSKNSISSWIIEPLLSYKLRFNKLKVESLVGGTSHHKLSSGLILDGYGFSSDLLLKDIHSAASVTNITTSNLYKYIALFGKINLNYDDEYIINVTGRRDGSSRFGPANQFHTFGALGAAWVFSKTLHRLQPVSFISFGKIHGSIGTTGNDQILDYKFLDLYSSTNVGVSYQSASGLVSNGLFNPNLQWEETRKINIGLELGFFKDRILINGQYFRNRSSNQLISYALPYITGFTGVSDNFPATVQNDGLELSVNSSNIKTNKISWLTSFNITFLKNKLLSFENLSSSSYASVYVVGKPITIVRAYQFAGVDPATGKYLVKDVHGNPTFTPDPSTDQTQIIDHSPKFYGGIQNSIQYKNIQLDIAFQFVKQIAPNYFLGNDPGYVGMNQPVWVLNRWQKAGDDKPIQRFETNNLIYSQFSNATSSTASYTDASYIRLKTLALNYNVPVNYVPTTTFRSISVYLQAQNLLTITRYKGMDPETQGSASSIPLPPLRTVTLGLHFGL